MVAEEAPNAEKASDQDGAAGPQKPFVENAKIHSNFIVPLTISPLSPAVVGVIFEEDTDQLQKYQLRLRRFGYSGSYINKFIRADKSKGVYNLISGTWFNKNTSSAQEYLSSGDYGFTFRVLTPLLSEEGSQVVKKQSSSGNLVAFDEVNFNIEASSGKLVGTVVLNVQNEKQSEKEVSYIYLLWANNAKYTLQQLELTNHSTDPHSLTGDKPSYEVKSNFLQGIELTGKFLTMSANQQRLVLVTDQQVQVFSPLKLEAPRATIKLPTSASRAKFIEAKDTIVLFNENGSKLQLLNIAEQTLDKKAEKRAS